MRPGRRRVLQLLTHGMELSWLAAWGIFVTAAVTGRPFPLLEATAALVGASLLTRLCTGRGWLVVWVLGLQALGLLSATAVVLHGFDYPMHPLLSRGWLLEMLSTQRSVQEWALLVLHTFWALLFWREGVRLAWRPLEEQAICIRFDTGLAAFFVLFLAKMVAALHAAAVDDPASHLFLLPYIVSGLLAIGMVRLPGEERKRFLPGYRAIGVLLTFSTAALLCTAVLVLFTLPYLTLAAQGGLFLLQRGGAAVSPFLLAILRFLFAPRTGRPDEMIPARTTRPTDALPAPEAGGWWMELLTSILAWSGAVLLALAGIAACAVMLYLLGRLLFSRTAAGGSVQGGWPRWSARDWLRVLRGVVAGLLHRWRRARGARDFYAALLAWGRRSGLPHPVTQTPSEFGARLAERFPRLEPEIALIVAAFNQEAYREAAVRGERLVELGGAWRRLRRPRHWPMRLKAWWRLAG